MKGSNSRARQYGVGETKEFQNAYRCHLAIIREDDGTYSVLVLNLPGAGSCGDTEEEAILNSREAIAGVLESYFDERAAIPWVDSNNESVPAGAKTRWIAVNV